MLLFKVGLSTLINIDSFIFLTLAPGECLSSYDVSALFTLVPVDPALNIIRDLLDKDHTIKERTVLAVNDIILKVEGVAMGSLVSPIAGNLYMEYLKQKALSTATIP